MLNTKFIYIYKLNEIIKVSNKVFTESFDTKG